MLQNKKNKISQTLEQGNVSRRRRMGNAIKVVTEDKATYAYILKDLNENVQPRKLGEDLKFTLKTKTGVKTSLPELRNKFQEALKDKAKIFALARKSTLVITNITDFTAEEENHWLLEIHSHLKSQYC